MCVQSQRADRLDNQTVICPLSAHTERADRLWTGCPKRCCRSCFQRAVYLGSPLPNTSLGLHPKTCPQVLNFTSVYFGAIKISSEFLLYKNNIQTTQQNLTTEEDGNQQAGAQGGKCRLPYLKFRHQDLVYNHFNSRMHQSLSSYIEMQALFARLASDITIKKTLTNNLNLWPLISEMKPVIPAVRIHILNYILYFVYMHPDYVL